MAVGVKERNSLKKGGERKSGGRRSELGGTGFTKKKKKKIDTGRKA